MHRIGDVLFALVIVAGALVVTRKQSKAASIVRALGDGFASAVSSATGQGGGGGGGRRRQGGRR